MEAIGRLGRSPWNAAAGTHPASSVQRPAPPRLVPRRSLPVRRLRIGVDLDRHSALGGHRSIASRAGLMLCALLPAGAAVGRRVMMRGEVMAFEILRSGVRVNAALVPDDNKYYKDLHSLRYPLSPLIDLSYNSLKT